MYCHKNDLIFIQFLFLKGMDNLKEVKIPDDVKKKLEKGDEQIKKQLEEDVAKYEKGEQT